ncbi:unnamed protein product [Phytophthora fragariaefolia]|uniref:Unnamed protein product n=1 Tax=Phytophthora fragariaefolia TaxID=1490495 RepID=A0A9W7D3H1_9STRA|nr:unnamed protein product [Phytophthora fragariaefolia]
MNSKIFSMSAAMPTWRMVRKDEETSSSRRDDPGVGSRRPREDDSDTSSSKRSRSGSDRPLTDAGPLSSTRSGGDSTPSGVETSRTAPVRDPWMPTSSEIESRFGSTAPPSQYALYSCSGIKDDDVTKELDFDLATDQRRDYYIGLFHDLQWYPQSTNARRDLSLFELTFRMTRFGLSSFFLQ